MTKLNLLLFFVFAQIILTAQTQVSGSQFGTWTLENSPYQVIGDLLIPEGAGLSIEAGVVVDFQEHYIFQVDGTLTALGTETDSIVFSSEVTWGGLFFNSSDGINLLSYCRIENGNANGEDFPYQHGGAIKLLYSQAEISNCFFKNNNAEGMGGAIYGLGTGAPDETTTWFSACRFEGNHATTEGGAIKLTADDNSKIIACEFINNSCDYGGGAIMFYSAKQTEIIQSLFVNNTSTYSDGGALLCLGDGNEFSLTNCTFYGNETVNGAGGAICLSYANVQITNSILYGNIEAHDVGDNLYLSQAAVVEVNNSNLRIPALATEDNFSGDNNIELNPLFIDENDNDFHLSSLSECIDAGMDVGLAFNGEAPDMGCYESDFSQNIERIKESEDLTDFVFPNPFTSNTSICYQLENDKRVNLSIYDITGRLVVTLVNKSQQNGTYTIVWNGKNTEGVEQISGIYFYKLNNTYVGRIIKQ